MKNTYMLFNIFLFFCLCNFFFVYSFKLKQQNGVISHDKQSSDENKEVSLTKIMGDLKKSMSTNVHVKNKEKVKKNNKNIISFNDKSEEKKEDKDKLKEKNENKDILKEEDEDINNVFGEKEEDKLKHMIQEEMNKSKNIDNNKSNNNNIYNTDNIKNTNDIDNSNIDDIDIKNVDNNDDNVDEARKGIIEEKNKINIDKNKKINNNNNDVSSNEQLLSILQQMDSSEAFKIVYDGFKNSFAEIAYQRLKDNPSEDFDEELISREMTKAGYGVFLEGKNKAMFLDWLKNKWDKVKNFAKESLDKLKDVVKQSGFVTKIKDYLKKEALPKAVEFLKNLSAKELPQVEQIMADSIKKLNPTLQKVVYPSIVKLFNKLENYLGIKVKDNVFAPTNDGEERILPEIKEQEDTEISAELEHEVKDKTDQDSGSTDAPSSVKQDWQDALQSMQSNQ